MAEIFVSPTGSDSNTGRIASPFKTIQKAATVAVAGDIVKIREGVYRETVTPANSGTSGNPIIFEAYNNENVVVSGADLVPNTWTDLGNSLFQTTLPMTSLGIGKDQLFVNGEMQVESRYPFVADETRQTRSQLLISTAGSGTNNNNGSGTGTLNHPDLAKFPNNFWVGGRVNFAGSSGEVFQTGVITAHSGEQITFSFAWFERYIPSAATAFYLWNKPPQAFNEGEFFIDSGNKLNFRPKNGTNPTSQTVEMKVRRLAFELAGKSYIVLRNISLFGASINTIVNNAHSLNAGTGIVIDNVNAKYLSHYRVLDGNPYIDGTIDTGFNIKGSGNEVRNSRLQFSAGNGISLGGNANKVINNVILDVDYAGSDSGAIFTDTVFSQNTGHVIEQNCVIGCGRGGIIFRKSNAGKVRYNLVEQYGRLCNDFGGLYTWGADGKQLEVAYNLVKGTSGKLSVGIYLDNNSINYIVHHNLVIGTGVQLNGAKSSGNKLFNNTIGGWVGYGGVTDSTNAELKNNIIFGPVNTKPDGVVASNNINRFDEPSIVSREQENYQLRSTSSAINAGVVLAPYTDGFVGVAPDIGCFEFGVAPWVAGALARSRDLSNLSVNVGVVENGKVTIKITIPESRRLPAGSKVKIGNNPFTANPVYIGSQAIFRDVDATGNENESVPIWLQTDDTNWQQVSSINLLSSKQLYTRQVTLTGLNSTLGLIALDTGTLINAGKLRVDCGDLRIFDNSTNNPIPFWIDGGINSTDTAVPCPYTLIFVRFASVPANGSATLKLTYGNKLLESKSDLATTFPALASTNNKLWLAANDGVTIENGEIVSVADRSGNLAGPTTVHTDWNKPVNVPNPQLQMDATGNPVFRFTGVEGFDIGSNFQIGSDRPRTIFVVKSYSSEHWNSCLYGIGYGGNVDLGRFVGAKPPQDRLTIKEFKTSTNSVISRNTSDGSLPRNRINLISIVSHDSGVYGFIQGVQQLDTSQKNQHYEIAGEFYIGRKRSDEKDRWYKGDIYEFIAFNCVLDDASRNAIEAYLSLKYGITSNNASWAPEELIPV
jgi:Domain of unknown function (DUF2341)